MWDEPFAEPARRAFLFLPIGGVALLAWRLLTDFSPILAAAMSLSACYLGYRVEKRLFAYPGHDGLLVKVAFASVMATFALAAWLYLQGAPWLIAAAPNVLVATAYHWWLMRRSPTK